MSDDLQTTGNREQRRAAERRARRRRAAGAVMTASTAALGATSVLFATGATPASANTPIVVSTAADSGAGSLRAAVTQANTDAGADTITFDMAAIGASNINVPTQLPQITQALDITGPGASALSLTGTGTERIFDLAGSFDVTISGLTLTHNATVVTGDGGAIRNEGAQLMLANDVVTGNETAGAGGGVSSRTDGSGLVVDSTTFSGNTAEGNSNDAGGAVFMNADGMNLQLTNATVTGNTATDEWAGGLYVYSADATIGIANSTISDNTAGRGGGGGWLGGENAHTIIDGSTISGNTAHGSGGGGLALYTDSVSVTNTTVSGNTADDDSGGGLYLVGNTLGVTIDHSTISDNTAGDGGGGVFLKNQYAPATISNTTVSGNTADGGGGGVYVIAGETKNPTSTVSIYNSTLSGNTASAGWGGGLYVGFQGDTVSVFNSTISGNTATDEGGGVSFLGYYGLSLVQTTITDNTGTTFGGLYLPGDEAASAAASKHHHAEANSADSAERPGGKVASSAAKGPRGQATQSDVFSETSSIGTIIAGNQGTDVGPGSTVDSDHSLFGTVAAGTTVHDLGGTQIGANPMLGPLTNNGGPTATHALLAGSPAIDASTNPVASFQGNEFDQRGPDFLRVVNVADIGAFEVQPPAAAPEAVVITPKFTG